MKKFWSLRVMLFLCGSTVFLLPGCKDKTENQPTTEPAIVQTTLNGSITLPTGSSRDVNALSILSPIANGTVTTGQYQVPTIKDEFTTQIAADAAGQPVLLGYSYPGQTDFAINAQSTVLAMLMNTGTVYSLTDAGKQQLIPKIKADPAFALAVQEVERLLRTPNTALLDTANRVLGDRIAALFTAVARRGTAGLGKAVTIHRSGRELTFVNAGVPFYNTVGIYKDGQQVQQLTVDGANFVADSPQDVYLGLSSAGGPSPTPASATYTMAGDGSFDIRVRSGKFTSAANGPEQRLACAYNLAQGGLLFLQGILPQLKLKNQCATAVAEEVLSLAFSFRDVATVTDATSASIAIAKFTKQLTGSAYNILQKCQATNANTYATVGFTSSAGKLFEFMNTQIARIGSTMNFTALTVGWAAYPAAQDTCYQASGSTVGPCGVMHLEAVSGDGQIGYPSLELPLPVRVRVLNSRGAGAKVRFTISSGSLVQSTTNVPTATLSTDVTTDANGYAQNIWAVGPASIPSQQLVATVLTADGQPTGTPITFSTTINSDGNTVFAAWGWCRFDVIYKTPHSGWVTWRDYTVAGSNTFSRPGARFTSTLSGNFAFCDGTSTGRIMQGETGRVLWVRPGCAILVNQIDDDGCPTGTGTGTLGTFSCPQ